MSSIPVHLGLDYHQSVVQVCVMDAAGQILANRDCPNQWEAIARLGARHGQVAGAALEACTGAASLADELVGRAGMPVQLAHPGFVSRMKHNPDKTDWGDARLLADLHRVGYLPQVWLAPPEVRELRRLVRYRQQLVHECRNRRLRITALLRDQRVGPGPGRRWTLRWLHWLRQEASLTRHGRWVIERHLKWIDLLTREILLVERQLSRLTAKDPIVQQLLNQPGIGPVTAWVMRAEIGRFDRFRSGKQLARFCGLSPCNASSGLRQSDAGLIRAGNRYLRATLIEAAHRLRRYQPRWKALGDALEARGKPASVVAAAIANRWMRWLYHQMVSQPAA